MTAITRLYRGENTYDFVKWWRRALVLSAVLVVLSITSLFFRGLNLGIDFEGGVSWEISAPGVSTDQARDALAAIGLTDAKIQIVGSDTLRVQGPNESDERTAEVRSTLGDVTGQPVAEVSVSTVGASWGRDITEASVRALVLFFAAILLYLTIRLEWRMAIAAILAVAHDVIISVGFYSIFQFEVTPGTVIAFLTILGYSIYDTIVVDDKIKENERYVGLSGRMTYTQMVNRSMNQVLLRSINTTVVALLPVFSLLIVGSWILGAVTLQEFSLALLVGLAAGAYSSIYVAAPILVWLKEKEPKNRTVAERLASSGGGLSATDGEAMANLGRVGAPASARAATPPPAGDSTASTAATSGSMPTGTIPPRPRKKSKKR